MLARYRRGVSIGGGDGAVVRVVSLPYRPESLVNGCTESSRRERITARCSHALESRRMATIPAGPSDGITQGHSIFGEIRRRNQNMATVD